MASLAQDTAILVIDMQEDFCPPNGALPVQGGRDIAPLINKLLKLPFKQKIGTSDWHPPDHISFASQHPGAEPFHTIIEITNPEALNKENPERRSMVLWPDHCVQGTPGAWFIDELDWVRFTHTLKKGWDRRVEAYSGFGPPFRKPPVGMSRLEDTLISGGINRVYVCGLALDFCVKWTAIDAADMGYETIVVEDATKPVNETRTAVQATKREMEAHGVTFVNSEILLSHL